MIQYNSVLVFPSRTIVMFLPIDTATINWRRATRISFSHSTVFRNSYEATSSFMLLVLSTCVITGNTHMSQFFTMINRNDAQRGPDQDLVSIRLVVTNEQLSMSQIYAL